MKMKEYQYTNNEGEVVHQDEAEGYVLDKLGITIIPKGKNGKMTEEQIEYISETVEWYFSGNWVKEEIKEEIEEINYQAESEDKLYQEALERKWGLL